MISGDALKVITKEDMGVVYSAPSDSSLYYCTFTENIAIALVPVLPTSRYRDQSQHTDLARLKGSLEPGGTRVRT